MTALYLIGGPGVGKSTVLAAAFPPLPDQEYRPPDHPLLWLTPTAGGATMLGRWRDRFPGTDALSYGVHPQAVTWAQHAELPAVLVGEGQRLGTVQFLTALAARTPTRVVWLRAHPTTLAARRNGRTQNPAWVAAAETRAANLAANLAAAGVPVGTIDTTTISAARVAAMIGR